MSEISRESIDQPFAYYGIVYKAGSITSMSSTNQNFVIQLPRATTSAVAFLKSSAFTLLSPNTEDAISVMVETNEVSIDGNDPPNGTVNIAFSLSPESPLLQPCNADFVIAIVCYGP